MLVPTCSHPGSKITTHTHKRLHWSVFALLGRTRLHRVAPKAEAAPIALARPHRAIRGRSPLETWHSRTGNWPFWEYRTSGIKSEIIRIFEFEFEFDRVCHTVFEFD